MSDKTVKEHLQQLEDKLEKRIGVDLPTTVWIVSAVITGDIIFNVVTTALAAVF